MLILKKIGLVLCGVVLGAVLVPFGLTTSQAASQAPTELCTMPVTGSYSPGALVRHEDTVYRCLYVFGAELKPAGVAWVKMDTTFTPKEPSQGR